MTPYTKRLFTFLLGALLMCSVLEAAPRSGVAKAGEDEEPAKTSSTQKSSGAPQQPVLSRRIVTKVDGVVVEERDTAAVQVPLLMPSAQTPATPPSHAKEQPTPRVPEGVVYGEAVPVDNSEPVPQDEAPAGSTEPPATPPEKENKPGEEFLGGLFSGFFDPSREAESNRMRTGKGRAMHLAPEGESGPTYTPMKVPEAPKESPYIAPSRNLIVGEIVSVDPEQGIAVGWMQSRFITLERNVITRNHELETTAVLRPTSFRNGRAYGLDIAVGLPRVGDELVLTDAGPAMRRQDELSVNVSLTVEPSAQN